MDTRKFVLEILKAHTDDKSVTDHAMTSISACCGILKSIALAQCQPDLSNIADELKDTFFKLVNNNDPISE